jgi:hypothetical protein
VRARRVASHSDLRELVRNISRSSGIHLARPVAVEKPRDSSTLRLLNRTKPYPYATFAMPHYLIYHSCDITQAQYQALATAITKLHCELCTSCHTSPQASIPRHYFSKQLHGNTEIISLNKPRANLTPSLRTFLLREHNLPLHILFLLLRHNLCRRPTLSHKLHTRTPAPTRTLFRSPAPHSRHNHNGAVGRAH